MINVERSIHIEGQSELDEVGVTVSYASAETNAMIEAVYTMAGEQYFRRSEDNGQTWQRTEEQWMVYESLGPNLQLNRGLLGSFLDKTNGWMCRAYLENQDIPDMVSWDPQSPAAPTPRYSTRAG